MVHVDDIARGIGCVALGGNVVVSSVAIDTRDLQPAALFVALKGEQRDGHDYVDDAFRKGAAAALVAYPGGPERWPGRSLLVVPDTRRALGELASWWRSQHRIPVVAVAGSNGKTTTREMIASILRQSFGADATLATSGNYNNDIGLPLTLLRLRPSHRVAVVEVGMNHPGETGLLAALCRPTIGLVANAQREHQEFMNGVAEVAKEHAALLACLPADGIAVVNADDAFYEVWRAASKPRRVIDFGLDRAASVTAGSTSHADGIELDLRLPTGQRHTLVLKTRGRHNVLNAVAAAAVAHAAAIPIELIAAGLAAFRPVKGRLQIRRGSGGATIVDDSYNANPDSSRAAIDVLASEEGRKVLAFGDMAEVGAQGPAYHEEVGRYARARGIDRVITLGVASAATARGFGSERDHHTTMADLISTLERLDEAGTTILIKGSRFMQMERVVDALAVSLSAEPL